MVATTMRMLLTYAMLSISCTCSALAQPCEDACPTVPWSPPNTITIQIAEDCVVLVTFARRVCQGADEVTVLGFTTQGACGNLDAADQLNKALASAVFSNMLQLGLPPMGPGVQYRTWRIRKPACVAASQGAVCDTTKCCVHEMSVRRLSDCPEWAIVADVQRDPNGGCHQTGMTSTQPCVFTCRGALLPLAPNAPSQLR